ncbi:anti-sigma regulatory factor [Argonema antarcticum]|uniref:anti-sigma regulatory factor n=1 Tax=Argonema antarcticum TaxID=2942763 RepID=UPI0020113BD5|nr:anti-sigma regulatory factor [Argonema antarcticum]MCL1474232.1 anti-sigma regulatory factor [Argonema antarcticum A004/B2]
MQKNEVISIRSSSDVVLVRQAVRQLAVELGFSLINQTKIVTGASELARNTLEHGGGGTVNIEALDEGTRRGLRLIFEDSGPGIPDLELALKDGFTTGGGLGMGLSGTKRLVNEFDIVSRVGEGTRITITKWK